MRSVVTVLGPTSPVYDLTTVEAVNAELNLASDTANDTEVAGQITAASRIIATECDRVFALQEISETFHIRFHEHSRALVLSRYPVTELTSVTVNDALFGSTNYELDAEQGMIWLPNYGSHWCGKITVLYQGGYDLPDDAEPSLARACIELIRSQRANTSYNPNVRDIWHNETRVSYFGPQVTIGALPESIAPLIDPFKRRGA